MTMNKQLRNWGRGQGTGTRFFFALLASFSVFALSAEPVNLALGKKVIYAVAPDNPTDPDCTKLTDGKINLPPQAGKNSANEYFDELRQNYTGGETMSKLVYRHSKKNYRK